MARDERMEPDLAALRESYARAGQGHVFAHWDALGERARRRLVRQLQQVDLAQLEAIAAAAEAQREKPARLLSPAPTFELADGAFPYAPNAAASACAPQGQRALQRGEVAVLLVAGGQGTRLGFDGPKGCYPILPISGMTLFEVFARKVLRAGCEYGRTPPLYVMVGAHNDSQTCAFFEQHSYFGLRAEDVQFFVQGEFPALDTQGRLVMAAPDALWTGPDGHGGVIEAMQRTGVLADMRARGVRYVSYVQVDNVQIPVADAAFIGLHINEGAEVSLKVVRKTDPFEKVGIFCLDDGVPSIVEYTEFSDEDSRRIGPGGRLSWWQGSIAVHCFGVDFLQRLADTRTALPLHAALKKVRTAAGETEAYKFERYVFDTLPLATHVVALEVPREEQFLPLKNPDGPFGPEGVRAAYQAYWKRALKTARPDLPEPPSIEVDPALCENARELAGAIEGREVNTAAPLRLELPALQR